MSDSIVIIGAGIAGLSAGCYGQMNGYRTQIFELHDKPGGLCTSWKRNRYTFDGCIHWLVGSRPGSGFNRVWQELGAVQGRHMIDHDEFARIEGQDGKAWVVYTDIDRLEAHMKTLAPGDDAVTEEFCQAARRFARFSETMDMVTEPAGLIDRISMGARVLPHIGALRKYGRMSIQAFAARFRDPFMREAFATLFDLPDFPMLAMLMTIGWMHNRDAGYPIGGSLAFAQAIERRYLDLGGKINYRSRVEKILVEDVPGTDDRQQARAVGVRLTDGSEHRADAVISAADGRATIFDMLDRGFVNDEIRGYYEELPIFQPMVQVSLGVARDLSDEPHAVVYPLTEPITVAGKVHRRLAFRHLCYDPSMAPAGKSVVIVGFESDYDFWKDLSQERERYDAEKQQIAIAVIDQLEKRLPGITGQIEAVDVATPMTTERYTGNWQGSIEGWLITTRTMNMVMGRGMSKTLPGLGDFYMAGQWVEPGGGLPSAALSGRKAIQMVCKCAGKPFQAQLP